MLNAVRLLLVDEDPFALESLTQALAKQGWAVDVAPNGGAAVRLALENRYDLAIVETSLAGQEGRPLPTFLHEQFPALPLLLISAAASFDTAVQGLRVGAVDLLAKPFHVEDLCRAVGEALRHIEERQAGAAEGPNGLPAAEAGEFEELIGRNPRMQRVYNLIRTVAPATSTVLITGESGTGKERVASAIHRRSPRRAAPFIRVNCSAFAEGVLESELFGHEHGAFTGAVRSRPGVFRRADGGTLFLDEIGDLPLATQVKLLRVIQEREVQPVGSDTPVPVDVRLVAATNHDLAAEAKAGNFREDLYFRLNVIPVHLPALRERPDDIPVLAEHFLAKFAAGCMKKVNGFTDKALAGMERYGWPGNVRELENAVERAVVLAAEEWIDIADLPPEVRGAGRGVEGTFQLNTVKLSEVEEIIIRRVLARTAWNIKRSAELLGITRATLYSKIRKFGLVAAR